MRILIIAIWISCVSACNIINEQKKEALWESYRGVFLNTHPYDPTVVCIEVLKIMDELETLGEDIKKLNMPRIRCKCTLGEYQEAISLAKQEDSDFLVALLKYIESNLSDAEKLFQPFIDKYSAKQFLTEGEFVNFHTSRVFVDGTDFNWESFKEEVYPKCVDIPDLEVLFFLSKDLHEDLMNYDGVKDYVCY